LLHPHLSPAFGTVLGARSSLTGPLLGEASPLGVGGDAGGSPFFGGAASIGDVGVGADFFGSDLSGGATGSGRIGCFSNVLADLLISISCSNIDGATAEFRIKPDSRPQLPLKTPGSVPAAIIFWSAASGVPTRLAPRII